LPSPSTGGGNNGGGSSGGSGGISGGSFNTPKFEQYSIPLNSSDGTTIGRFEGKDYNSVLVYAVRNVTIGNFTYELSMEGELSSKPVDDCWLNFNFMENSAELPPGMNDVLVLGMVNVTKKPGDWSYKSGSPQFMLKITGYSINLTSGDDLYLVRSDGRGYQIQKAVVNVSGSQLSVKFTASGDTGLFTLIKVLNPTPTPTITPTPLPTVTPTPIPENGIWGFPIFIGVLISGIIIGAAALFLLTRFK
jgi:hypothetical protein